MIHGKQNIKLAVKCQMLCMGREDKLLFPHDKSIDKWRDDGKVFIFCVCRFQVNHDLLDWLLG
jgi:hypothetical protein